MRGPHNIWRLIRTGATLERTGAMGIVLDAFSAPKSLRVAARIIGKPFAWLGHKGDPSQPPATRALTALGPAYIKFGQVLSTRPDVVGDEMAAQLRVLQDKLPPFPRDVARQTVADELDTDPDALFSEFSEPVAAASIAQVHKAKLRDGGREVAVKVLRPGIERAFRDVDAHLPRGSSTSLQHPRNARRHPGFHGTPARTGSAEESPAAAEFAANNEGDDGLRFDRRAEGIVAAS